MFSAASRRRRAGGHLGEVVARAATCPARRVSRTVLELVEPAPADAVLELGCGSGRLLSAVAARLRRGFAAGHRPLGAHGAARARARNRRVIAQGRADGRVAAASDDLGRFAEARFDKVYGTHVVYFWMEPARDLAEIRARAPARRSVSCSASSRPRTAPRAPPATRWSARCVCSRERASPTSAPNGATGRAAAALAWLKGARS